MKVKPTKFLLGITASFVLSAALVSIVTIPVGPAASAVKPLKSYIAATPSGFVSEKTDLVGGGPTGAIAFSEAVSADCNAGRATRAQWVGSALRYYDKSLAAQGVYMLLCVTQYRSLATSKSNMTKVAAIVHAKKSASVSVPGAVTAIVGPTRQIMFTKGDYFVFIVAASLNATINPTSYGVNLARRQLAALPG